MSVSAIFSKLKRETFIFIQILSGFKVSKACNQAPGKPIFQLVSSRGNISCGCPVEE